MHPDRVRFLKKAPHRDGPVIYWMSRDQRSRDNWALWYAQAKALEHKSPLLVVFCVVSDFLEATIRQYAFMIKGLHEVEQSLEKKNIPFHCLVGDPKHEIPQWIEKTKASCLITDFDPLRIKRRWKDEIIEVIKIPFLEVDAHNIVPCWKASPKQEFGAYTLRPKIQRLLDEFLEEIPEVKRHPVPWGGKNPPIDWMAILKNLKINTAVSEVGWLIPGEKEAQRKLNNFLKSGLALYPAQRNDPNEKGQSDLSPYLHFGHLSAQRIALEVQKKSIDLDSKRAFLEELIVRRELSDNYCFYNFNYDNFAGFPSWAKKTLDEHRRETREYIYTQEEFENGFTHDPLWNAAQMEMVRRGKMHGYLRMYWAKKILEWTPSPEEAQRIAVYLNDRYELDGRDPNGYTGIAWSIGGVHDRAWGERSVFGKIRYMSFNGAKSKFDVSRYIAENLIKDTG
jgi:deoxyribodipyrimidine photo-lyase